MTVTDLETLLRSIDEEHLGEWLRGRRWFGSKAQELSHFAVLDTAPLSDEEGARLLCALFEARFNAGTHDLYQVLVGDSGGELIAEVEGTPLFDALADPAEAAVLAHLMRDSASVGPIRFHWTGALEGVGTTPRVRSMGAEQSNSSIVFDERLVLKIFRRLEPGDNPELEMLRFLSERGFPNIAALGGWYDFCGERLEATMGVLQEFIPDGRDGWEMTLDAARAGDTAFLDRLRELGEVTGRMHTVLGSDGTDPTFAPEEPGMEALGLLSATIDEEIERTFTMLDEDDPRVAAIAGRGGEVRDLLQLLSHQATGGRLIRHHGDYHLGQTLLTPDGWIVLDFEGEPARPLNERRRKRSPLRDIAGMLRSIAYAASTADVVGSDWERDARAAFLGGYMSSVEPSLLPAGEVAVSKLLSIYELEKAVYELRYELDNRPDWVGIPVAGILRLLEAPA
jgi:trehalose synthase-fused probable maltokinase